ncbi:MAG: hypothetical protein ACHP7N_06895 [Caulobacterales bacterium]
MTITLPPPQALNLTTPYSPAAVYYPGADTLEYIRRDVPAVYRRVDATLTLIFDMDARDELIGFCLKGFRAFYLEKPHPEHDFPSLVGLLERALTTAGDGVFEAYHKAKQMALDDKVVVDDLPSAVAR